MVGAVGDDEQGERMLRGLRDQGIDVTGVEVRSGTSTGLASIWVDAQGENAIAVAPGANALIDAEQIDRHLDRIAAAEILLLQLEVPIAIIAHLLRRLPASGPRVILDPAPARDLAPLPLERVEILTPNEHELEAITLGAPREEAPDRLLDRGVRHVICTLGAEGADVFSADGTILHVDAPEVAVLDTTAAGDAFTGALAWALGRDDLQEAVSWAVVAGALATTVRGAQPSLPDLRSLEALHRCL